MRPFTSIVTNAQQTLLFVVVVVIAVVVVAEPTVCYCVYVGVRYMFVCVNVFEKNRGCQAVDATREVQILEIRFLLVFRLYSPFPQSFVPVPPFRVPLHVPCPVPPCSPLQPVLKVLPVKP